MKKSLLVVTAACILLTIAVPAAFASALTPTDDAWVNAGTADTYNTTSLIIQSSTPCTVGGATSWAYLKWDLNSVAKQIGTANISFVVSSTPALGSQASTLSLFAVTDDSWTETNVGTSKPTLGASLTSVTFDPSTPPAQGGTVAFPSTTSLVDFLNQQIANDPAGAKYASFGLAFSACSAGAPSIRFASTENITYTAPQMSLLDTNAVTLTTFGAAGPAVNWPLIAGLGALVLFIAAGVVIYRRRATVRA